VSSTTTLAIHPGTQLGLDVPDGDPAKLVAATATLTLLVGALLVLARLLRLGSSRRSFRRPCSRASRPVSRSVIVARPGAEAVRPGTSPSTGFFADLLAVVQHLPETSLLTLAWPPGRR
jgi:hypothetical protein